MDLIGNNFYTMALTQFCHGFQLITRPHFARRILWATEQKNFALWTRQGILQRGHVAVPTVSAFFQFDSAHHALITFNCFVKRVVRRRMNHHRITRRRPLADQLRYHIDDRGAINQRLRIDLGIMTR
ncbi:hypothetical protein SDC9_183548 [bioreactor metagenome]|uniref:Uncharacterized protein n=1 Tax=bioreactor metagenome TaxID=1076179 RepID=A0A645HK83_9ZZZZ